MSSMMRWREEAENNYCSKKRKRNQNKPKVSDDVESELVSNITEMI